MPLIKVWLPENLIDAQPIDNNDQVLKDCKGIESA
jgi:hypothetical protein